MKRQNKCRHCQYYTLRDSKDRMCPEGRVVARNTIACEHFKLNTQQDDINPLTKALKSLLNEDDKAKD